MGIKNIEHNAGITGKISSVQHQSHAYYSNDLEKMHVMANSTSEQSEANPNK